MSEGGAQPQVARRRLDPWPVSIVVFFTVAVAGCVSFVAFCNLHSTDLVAPDYYEQELKYQGHIDQVARTRGLGVQVRIIYDAELQRITFALPGEGAAREGVEGRMRLYRPSAAGMDREIKLRLDERGTQVIEAAGLGAGLWRVQVWWRAGGLDYYAEQMVVVRAPSSSGVTHGAQKGEGGAESEHAGGRR